VNVFSSEDNNGIINWEEIGNNKNFFGNTYRAKIPGGWLFLFKSPDSSGTGTTFIPDPEHKWDGNSL